MQFEVLIKPEWIIPIVPEGVVLRGWAVALEAGRIAALISPSDLPSVKAREIVELPGEVLTPGLVNAHSHAAMNLLRGMGPDLPLKDWLEKKIWPAEGRLVGPEFVRDGSRLAGVEMLLSGITCTNDMYFFPDEAAKGLAESGMRCAVSAFLIGFPSAWAKNDGEYLKRALELIDALSGRETVRVTVAPHAPYTVGDESLRALASIASERGLPIHMHVQETAGEVSESLRIHGVRPLERMRRLGLVTGGLISVHSVHLDDGDITMLAEAGSTVCLCPSSNMKLASGLPPVKKLLDAGVNIAIGTDGAASNDKLDLLGETRLAALVAKAASGDPTAAPIHRMLYAATMGGAKALGWDDEIGSIEPGKAADLASFVLDEATSVPGTDSAARLLYSAGRENVSHVWVNGDLVAQKQQNMTLHKIISREEALLAAHTWQNIVGS